ncbi:SGNH/GDSL hydrolase family protein [Cryptosporangium phraense]|uniref:SGNH/GDSL hydrolase family protein n=1 Tax=Cryptosporangium phraense TaxID=2593070 RepID=A0A545AS69_9ACTN|nr:SGNH/GDSL hydrolase family protein [Cryptosporangium phraense]TQS44164.1 SGNH/GDSL hydrolase family protein [Cryptosporangium phraense]
MTQPVGRVHAAISRRIPHLPDAAGPLAGLAAGDGEPLSVLFVGDSSVAGVGAGHHGEALAGQFSAALAERTGRPVSWQVLARSGDTVRGITALVSEAAAVDADVVVLSAGTNDALRFRRPSAWRADVSVLVDALRARIGRPVPVLLVSIPPVHRFGSLPRVFRWSIGGYARLLDRQLARLCLSTPGLGHLLTGPLPVDTAKFFAMDRFHPSPLGYRTWGRLLAAAAVPYVLEMALAPTSV